MTDKMYKPSDLRAFLLEKGIRPKKGLSQNFLIDGNIIQKIVKTAGIEPGEIVIEIGPGPGALTQALLEAGARVIAIEKDRTLAGDLARFQTEDQRLSIHCEDALSISMVDLLQGQSAKVVANLPYQITTPLLTTLLPLYPAISSLTVMVQKEFAARLKAKPRSADYSSITLFLEFYATFATHFTVSPSCFYPQPTVHSSVVHCNLHTPPLPADKIEPFFLLTRTAFQQKRKMLKVSCKELFSSTQIEEALKNLGLSPTARPEELSLSHFLALFALLWDR